MTADATAASHAESTAAESERCAPDELRTLFLFEELSDDHLQWLSEHGHVARFEAGWVCREGDPATCLYVLLEGEIALSRRVGADDVELSRTGQRGVYSGAWASYLGDRVQQVYFASVRAITASRMFVLSGDDFAWLMRAWFPMPVHLLEGLFLGNRTSQNAIMQRERLLALGSLSAGLTHELNNPAAAAVRATARLRERVAGMRHKLALIAGGTWDAAVMQSLVGLQEDVVEQLAKAPTLGPLEASDREDELTDWLDAHDIGGGYDLAPTFVQGGVDVAWLERTAATVAPDVLEGAVRWLAYTLETELLLSEIEDSTNRISTLVGAAKQYSQMDRAPFQVVDVHELLDSTLVMLGPKFGSDITVVKNYDRTLPEVSVYAAELNQVWTNLIDNALQAMPGGGTLTVSTTRHGDGFQVEIADTGTGIDPEVVPRIFEPFFTTKAVGEGTGLGLDISWRIVVSKHHGDLSVSSTPGDTRFRVRIPFEAPSELVAAADSGVSR